jgi:hypothetical protein
LAAPTHRGSNTGRLIDLMQSNKSEGN